MFKSLDIMPGIIIAKMLGSAIGLAIGAALLLFLQGCAPLVKVVVTPPPSRPPACTSIACDRHEVHINRHSVYIGVSKGW